MTPEQLKAKFPNASRSFLERNGLLAKRKADNLKENNDHPIDHIPTPIKNSDYYQTVIKPKRDAAVAASKRLYTPVDISTWPTAIPAADLVICGRLDIEPKSQKRARVGRDGKFYHPKESRAYQDEVRRWIGSQIGDVGPDGGSRFGVRCAFYRPNRQRMDVDNMLKAICDAATGSVWDDDSQVVEIFGRLYLASSESYLLLAIYRIEDESPQLKCKMCGVGFVRPPSVAHQFCSHDCFRKSKLVQLQCEECLCSFTLRPSDIKGARRFCSNTCANRNYGRIKSSLTPPPTCTRCGVLISRTSMGLCRKCYYLYRTTNTT